MFGLNDGLVTTLVFVLAISQVAHPQIVVIALGELFAGGLSMGLGGYLSARTERAILRQRIATERYEIMHEPEEERSELRQIYQEKGFRGPLLDRLVRELTADHQRWLQAMIRDELGVVHEDAERPPWLQGALISGAFMVGALVPILPFALSLSRPQLWAYGLTVVTAIVLGAVKARYTVKGPFSNALEF
ncbi:MAG: VIT1/CCC1 transporter family protein, partial [Candidatus Dormibacteraceae bacterium]